MDIMFFVGGIVVGVLLTKIFSPSYKICGSGEVDERNGMCRVHVTDEGLSDRSIKKAIFTIQHDANISREEQTL